MLPKFDSCDAMMGWYFNLDAELGRFAVDWPACFGGQYRFDDGGAYVSESVVSEVLPEPSERDLWLILSNLHDERARAEVLRHIDDPIWLSAAATALCGEEDAVCYYTEAQRGDFAPDELDELLRERPDLRGTGR